MNFPVCRRFRDGRTETRYTVSIVLVEGALKHKAIAVLLFLVSSNLALALLPQGAAPKARIEGIVLKAGTKDPVSGVRVNVIRFTNYTGPIAGPGGVLSASFSPAGPPPPPPPSRGGATPSGSAPLPPIPTALTDEDGKFVIPDLDPGPYRLSFVAPAYVKQQYGQRTFKQAEPLGKLVHVAASSKQEVDVTIIPASK